MSNIENVYYNLTNVDLDEQRDIWDERGRGYYGEFLVFEELYSTISGCCKFLMNVQIPAQNGKTTEIDLIMIHETGIYVFEIKHYKGTIYGSSKERTWTQYFRTACNETFRNPVLQNDYHIQALSRMFSNIPIYSVVVFTHDECSLRIKNDNSLLQIVRLRDLLRTLETDIENRQQVYDLSAINNMFERLVPYSPMRNVVVTLSETETIPFYDYLQKIKSEAQKQRDIIQNCERKRKHKCWLICSSALLVCALFTFVFCLIQKSSLAKEYKHKLWVLQNESELVLYYEQIICDKDIEMIDVLDKLDAEKNNVQQLTDKLEQKQSEYESVLSEKNEQIDKLTKYLSAVKANCQRVDVDSDENLKLIKSFINVDDICLEKSKTLQDTVLFTCTLADIDKEYGIKLNQNTKYIVVMRDGIVQEYDMFGQRLNFSAFENTLSGSVGQSLWNHERELKTLEIHNAKECDDIEYIKITNVSLWKYPNDNKLIANDLELELYSALEEK